MEALVALAIAAILAVVVWIVSAPIRHPAAERGDDELAELLAAKEQKYTEIRDAEMDRRTGKLSEADWKTVDRELRAEAVTILRRIDELGGDPAAAER